MLIPLSQYTFNNIVLDLNGYSPAEDDQEQLIQDVVRICMTETCKIKAMRFYTKQTLIATARKVMKPYFLCI